MARLDWANQGRNGKLCPYKRITGVICAVNVVAALYVLHFLYTSFFVFASPSNVPPAFFGAVKYTDDQIRKMEESIRIRRAAEPIELIKLVEGIKAEFSAEKNVSSLSRSMKQMIADEVLQRLKGMKSNANVSEQREFLEIWRKEKMEEVQQLMFGNGTSNSTIPAEGAKTLERVLESEWFLLLEDIGVWIPAEIIHKERNDTLQNEEDLDDEIVAGRPLPPECHAEAHTDYDGAAVKWGLTHHKESAADCCQACLDQAKRAKPGELKCNIWVYCPAENGCYSPDIYIHKHQECWLKQVIILAIRSRAMEAKHRRKDGSTTESLCWVLSPLKGEAFIAPKEKKDEEYSEEYEDTETFFSAKSCFSRCSSMSGGFEWEIFRRRKVWEDFCHLEGWPFGLYRKMMLLPPLPRSPSDSWTWCRPNQIAKMS